MMRKCCLESNRDRCRPSFYRYIGWISDDKLTWQLNAAGMAADPVVEISARPIPQEPLVSSETFSFFMSFNLVLGSFSTSS